MLVVKGWSIERLDVQNFPHGPVSVVLQRCLESSHLDTVRKPKRASSDNEAMRYLPGEKVFSRTWLTSMAAESISGQDDERTKWSKNTRSGRKGCKLRRTGDRKMRILDSWRE